MIKYTFSPGIETRGPSPELIMNMGLLSRFSANLDTVFNQIGWSNVQQYSESLGRNFISGLSSGVEKENGNQSYQNVDL